MDYHAAIPEIFLACAGMALLLVGAYRRGNPTQLIARLAVLCLIVTAVLVLTASDSATAFGGLFIVDRFGVFFKVLVLAGSSLAIIMSMDYIEREGMSRFEFPILMLLATVGMLLMLSANDLISLYLGLELQSLALYVVAAFRRDDLRSTEAGMKYFVLGALSSGMLLYGASMVYGFTGTTAFVDIAAVLTQPPGGIPPVGIIVGIVLVIAGLAFKVSAVPFHMWTPDVYEGAPTPVTAFFAAAPKLAAMGLLVRVMMEPFGHMVAQWQQIIVFVSIASMVLGAVAAINQENIKRLMAYSSIGHVGYALVGLAAGTREGVVGVLVYMAIYLVMNVGTFGCILLMRQKGRMVEGISDLAGLAKTKPAMAAALAILMFSMAGIPPMAGFLGKLFVFRAAVNVGLYWLAVIGVVASVVSAFYYLRIIKVMYFDEPVESLDRSTGWVMNGIIAVSSLTILLFFALPGPVIDSAAAAAASLFPG
ncbi:MAG TPA: NADH-quinone oxidoreductase subunit NuoN [Verrucomicrobiae bacterium]|nr:NADH-quinone oxidoreductase subunit NuoN [Verrucomicrobiae bacterium]